MIFGFLLSIASITGYILSAHYWLKIPFRLSPVFTFSSLMIVLFWAALAHLLHPVSILLFTGGCIFCVVMLVLKTQGHRLISDPFPRDSLFLLTGLITLAFGCALVGQPSVIDDYTYWAIISKSIATFDALPIAGTSIFARHLTYTPGLALFHYYFFSAFSSFHISVAYFAQNLFLISLLFALTDKQNKRTSLTLVGGAIILLVLFSGSIFQKLRVDHFLSLTSAVIIWTQMKNRFSWPRLLVIATAISSLYLVKEVGFLLAIFTLLAVLFDFIYMTDVQVKEKRAALCFILLLFIYLILQKIGWENHCTSLGFHQFHSAISLKGIRSAFDFSGNSNSWQGFTIFLKSIILGSADRLKLPYLVWYFLLGALWFKTFKGFSKKEQNRHLRLFSLTIFVFLLYLAMNYVMQVLIFGLGTTTQTTTSLSRYINIFLCWFILFTVTNSLVNLSVQTSSKAKWPTVICIIAALLLAGSSLPQKTKPYEREIKELVVNTVKYIKPSSRVCISPGRIEDHYLGFRMNYLLFPTRFNVSPFPEQSGQNNLEQKLSTCDYLLIYMPDQNTGPLFSPFTSDQIEHKNLFKVRSAPEQTTLSLQRIF